jgi:pyrroloquinoline quinone biosynthesis protein D
VSEAPGSKVPKLPRGVRLHFDQVRNAHVLLAPERAFNVDSNAVAVLQLVDGQRTVADIAGDLATQFNADRSVIERDVAAMIDDLISKRVVEAA